VTMGRHPRAARRQFNSRIEKETMVLKRYCPQFFSPATLVLGRMSMSLAQAGTICIKDGKLIVGPERRDNNQAIQVSFQVRTC
jgi:hypothetical protein